MVGVSGLDFDFISDEARHNYVGLPDRLEDLVSCLEELTEGSEGAVQVMQGQAGTTYIR